MLRYPLLYNSKMTNLYLENITDENIFGNDKFYRTSSTSHL